ncbi:hypothetical protein BOTBODRAFT_192252 [Botryobasidium botryosum FD-172 SS1]|uniref:HNH nuclease domain-containing protein n=1 Tax=Botryobasidium botryosum (strain FD-172 SS1) TaxID=930990 RepID=A0A067LWF1_BOTB1|nr:hypothetical protein BOTBODRAFT_192252 [Botryobasidium botryosum FD-172 SS1]
MTSTVNLHTRNTAARAQDEPWLHLLAIPLADIQRLCHRPFKWLRFVLFAICGVKGDLYLAPGGEMVDYQSTLAQEFQAGDYYYIPNGSYNFIDPKAINGRHTSIETVRRADFRDEIIARDGHQCPFSVEYTPETMCDSAHIIPHSKGSNYLIVLVQSRKHLYGIVDTTTLGTYGIDSTENGLFMRAGIHRAFTHAICGFLQTPNFALATEDIPYPDDTPMPHARCTLQFFEHQGAVASCDARFRGTGVLQPWSLFLDFMYGAAVFHKWASGADVRARLGADAEAGILAAVAAMPPEHLPPALETGARKQAPRKDEPKLSKAMDAILFLGCMLNGTTPQGVMERIREAEEQSERRRREESRSVAEAWCKAQADI